MKSNGEANIRKIGKDYYFKAEDIITLLDYFAEDALAYLSHIDDDEMTEFDMGVFEGQCEVLDDLSKTVKLMGFGIFPKTSILPCVRVFRFA